MFAAGRRSVGRLTCLFARRLNCNIIRTAALPGWGDAAASSSDFPPIATGCVAARRAEVGRASAPAVKKTSAHAKNVGTSVGILGEKFDPLNIVYQRQWQYRQYPMPICSRIIYFYFSSKLVRIHPPVGQVGRMERPPLPIAHPDQRPPISHTPRSRDSNASRPPSTSSSIPTALSPMEPKRSEEIFTRSLHVHNA